MAPEVMCRQNHGVAADYFAVGVIAYECMNGRRPYVGKSRREIREQILAKQIQIKRVEIPPGWSIESADFINKVISFPQSKTVQCLQRKPSNRIGLNGNHEVKAHAWFKDFDWMQLQNRKSSPSFVPPAAEDNFDLKHVNNNDWKDADVVKENQVLLRRNSIQALFKGYYYDKHNHQAATPSTKQNSVLVDSLSKDVDKELEIPAEENVDDDEEIRN